MYQELRLKRTHKYIIFKLSPDNTEIFIERTGDDDDYDRFLRDLPEDGCRWAVYDFGYEAGS
jgi:cofilin